MRRFFVAEPMTIGKLKLTGDNAHHIKNVLRMPPGSEIHLISLINGQKAKARICSLEASHVWVNVAEIPAETDKRRLQFIIAQGLPKADKMDFIVQKAVELGVSGIVPVTMERCVVRYDADKKTARRERWQRIALEAAKQCGQDQVPEIAEICSLEALLNKIDFTATAVFLLYEGKTALSLKQALACPAPAMCLLIIGPEGGFSEGEVDLCRQSGVQTVTMGPRILRTETASLAAASLVLYQWGDLGGEE